MFLMVKAGLSGADHSSRDSSAVSSYRPSEDAPIPARYPPPMDVEATDGVRCEVQGDTKIVTLTLGTSIWALNGSARALVGKNAWVDAKDILEPPRLRQLVDQGLMLCGTRRVEPMVMASKPADGITAKAGDRALEKRMETHSGGTAPLERPMTAESLVMASNDGDMDFVRHWVGTGKSVNVHNNSKSTPIGAAAASGNCDILDVLLAHGGFADTRSSKVGFTPLYFAAHKGNSQCVDSLLKKKVRLNVRITQGGDTPLIAASYMGNYEAAKLLVDAGASLTITNGDGDTPYRAAAAFGNVALSSYIQSKGGH